jgi:hypothetical protein
MDILHFTKTKELTCHQKLLILEKYLTKMETLNGKNIDSLKFQNSLTRIADVQNFEGSLLTLFENTLDKHLYLFDWVDRDAQFNRWIVYRCKPNILQRFICAEVSQYDLLMSDKTYCNTIDIDKNLSWNNIRTIKKTNLPASYFPQKDVFFKKSDCPNFQEIVGFIGHRKINQKKQRTLLKKLFSEGLERGMNVIKKQREFESMLRNAFN